MRAAFIVKEGFNAFGRTFGVGDEVHEQDVAGWPEGALQRRIDGKFLTVLDRRFNVDGSEDLLREAKEEAEAIISAAKAEALRIVEQARADVGDESGGKGVDDETGDEGSLPSKTKQELLDYAKDTYDATIPAYKSKAEVLEEVRKLEAAQV